MRVVMNLAKSKSGNNVTPSHNVSRVKKSESVSVMQRQKLYTIRLLLCPSVVSDLLIPPYPKKFEPMGSQVNCTRPSVDGIHMISGEDFSIMEWRLRVRRG